LGAAPETPVSEQIESEPFLSETPTESPNVPLEMEESKEEPKDEL
jgi:hypothetical protein